MDEPDSRPAPRWRVLVIDDHELIASRTAATSEAVRLGLVARQLPTIERTGTGPAW